MNNECEGEEVEMLEAEHQMERGEGKADGESEMKRHRNDQRAQVHNLKGDVTYTRIHCKLTNGLHTLTR